MTSLSQGQSNNVLLIVKVKNQNFSTEIELTCTVSVNFGVPFLSPIQSNINHVYFTYAHHGTGKQLARGEFGLKCLQTKLFFMWRVGIGNLVVIVKTFNCSEMCLTISGTNIKAKKLPSVHVLGDFKFKDIDWPDRLNKSGSALSQSEGQMLTDIMNDHGRTSLLENKMHWIYYSFLFLVSFGMFTHRTNSAIMILLLEVLKLSFSP